MNPSASKKRKTEILDDVSAVAIGAPIQKKTKKADDNRGSRPFGFTSRPPVTHKRAGAPPKAAPRAPAKRTDASQHAFYEGVHEGVTFKVPLLQANGRKKGGARQYTTLLKQNKNDLLQIVELYAGKAERQARENQGKDPIIRWIEQVEKIAFEEIHNPKGVTTAQGVEVAPKAASKACVIPHHKSKAFNRNHEETANKKVLIDESAKTYRNASGPANGFTKSYPQVAASTPRLDMPPPPAKKSTTSKATNITEKPGRQNIFISPPLAKKATPKAINITEKPGRQNISRSRPPAKKAPPKATNITEKPGRQNISTSPPPAHAAASDDDGDFDAMMSGAQAYFESLPPEKPHQGALSRVPTYQLDGHPLIRELGLDPNHPYNHTKIVNLPEQREHVIITATSMTAVHETRVPYPQAQVTQPPRSAPFLKPGKHGWDWDLHKFHFRGDPDLETGVGHQIEPADQGRFESDPGFEKVFKQKYPGVLANQWPCGCQKPWNDDESEDES